MRFRNSNVFRAFLFTDLEGSTRRWERDARAMQSALARHDAILRQAIIAAGGEIFTSSGDGVCAAFPDVQAALQAAHDGQLALREEDFSAVGEMRVRMAIHAGAVEARDDNYFGPPLNRTARLAAAAHGGQILLSAAAAEDVLELPGAALRDLGWHRLRDLAQPEHVFQHLAPGLAAEFPVLRSLDSLPNNLPLQATSFIGRSEELSAVSGLLARHRLVTLLGSGGLGKTRLGLQLGAECLGRFADGVWLIELAPLNAEAQIAETVAAVLGIGSKVIDNAGIANYLKYQRLMLILDNCEHLIEGVAALADAILKTCPSIVLLATSREPLRIAGEQIFPLPGLALPGEVWLSAAEAMAHAGVQLFVERATLAAPDFQLSDQNAPIIGAICRHLDGIALAIELAAARIKLLSPAELLARLQQSFDILSGGNRSVLPRQQTLHATIAWSFDLLSPAEQLTLCRLAVFKGGFSLGTGIEVAAATPVTRDEAFDHIAALAEKSMISRLALVGNESRYRMLETTRAFCLEKLAADGQADTARRRLAMAMVTLYEAAEAAWPTRDTAAWVGVYGPDFENLSEAIDWALSAGEAALGLELVSVADSISHQMSSLAVLLRWYDLAEKLIGPATPAGVEARIKSGAAGARQFGSGANFAATLRALELYRQLNDTEAVAYCLARLAWIPVYDGRSQPEFERACLEEARAMLPRIKTSKLRSAVLMSLAGAVQHLEGPEQATPLIEEAMAIAERYGDLAAMRWSLNALALNHFDRGDLLLALALSRKGVEQCRDFGHRWLLGAFLCDITAYACLTGGFAEARAAAPGAFENFRSLNNEIGTAWTIERVALLAACEGRIPEAAALAGYCEAAFEAHHWPRDGTQTAVRTRLIALLDTASESRLRTSLMQTGAGWSADQAFNAALAIIP
jgi:predicted ATPase/class 3 adenylate cyclase